MTSETKQRWWWRATLGGRVRLTTVILILLWVGALVLYGWTSEHYSNEHQRDSSTHHSSPAPHVAAATLANRDSA